MTSSAPLLGAMAVSGANAIAFSVAASSWASTMLARRSDLGAHDTGRIIIHSALAQVIHIVVVFLIIATVALLLKQKHMYLCGHITARLYRAYISDGASYRWSLGNRVCALLLAVAVAPSFLIV